MHHLPSLKGTVLKRVMFHRRQRERKLDVFFSAKKAQDVCRAMVRGVPLCC
jgi:hypothetical protein